MEFACHAARMERPEVEENKFRCLVCRKLFCGQSFLHRHLLSKHKEEVLDARRRDQYFDGDVGMEDAVPASAGIQTSRGQDTMTVRGTSVLDFAKSDASAPASARQIEFLQ